MASTMMMSSSAIAGSVSAQRMQQSSFKGSTSGLAAAPRMGCSQRGQLQVRVTAVAGNMQIIAVPISVPEATNQLIYPSVARRL